MGIKNIIFFTLWIILGNFCATFAFAPDTATGAEFGECADWGGGEGGRARFSCEIIKNEGGGKNQCKAAGARCSAGMHRIRNRSGPCAFRDTRFVSRFVARN